MASLHAHLPLPPDVRRGRRKRALLGATSAAAALVFAFAFASRQPPSAGDAVGGFVRRLRVCVGGGDSSDGGGTSIDEKRHSRRPVEPRRRRRRRRIGRLAVLRPFGTRVASVLPATFDEWDGFLPCDLRKRPEGRDDEGSGGGVRVDLVLSFSREIGANADAAEGIRRTTETFRRTREEGLRIWREETASGGTKNRTRTNYPWAACFDGVRVISASIPPEKDLYLPRESDRNPLWVNGPNRQFVKSMEELMSGDEFGNYDAALLMEGDSVPVRQYWLDDLIEEAENGAPFATLGSKYVGDSWDKFRSSLPLSLQHHLNGNALYNLSHPLLHHLVRQLGSEEDTPYNAVPYDYRIAQILLEGMLGVKPEVPPGIAADFAARGIGLSDNMQAFRRMWEEHGGRGVMRESRVIANYAGTNLLPRHVKDMNASIVHGAQHYLPWNVANFNITLVVTEWHHELSLNLLSRIDSSDHPFSNIVLMVPADLTADSERHLSSASTALPVRLVRRSDEDGMDLCSAPVDTEWFMITNSYHTVAGHVDLLFRAREEEGANKEGSPPKLRQAVPYTPANDRHCLDLPACRDAMRFARRFDAKANKVVHDADVAFHARARDDFCEAWRNESLEDEEVEGRRRRRGQEAQGDTRQEFRPAERPSATSYVAYLSGQSRLDGLYGFTDRTMFGSRDHFVRAVLDEEEAAAAGGEGSALSNRILTTREGMSLGLSLNTGQDGGGAGKDGTPATDLLGEDLEGAVPSTKLVLRSQFDPMLELRRLEDIARAPTGATQKGQISQMPSQVPSQMPSQVPSQMPSQVPSGQPTAVPSVSSAGDNSDDSDDQDDNTTQTTLDNFYKCRDWCTDIDYVPWWSTQPGGVSKCSWKNICWKCEECGGRNDNIPNRHRRRHRGDRIPTSYIRNTVTENTPTPTRRRRNPRKGGQVQGV